MCDVAIGQSTLATQRVKANLFYRGLTFHRFPIVGDTLFTRTEVVGLKQNSAKPGRAATGLAALRMTTIDQVGRLVLDFHRCAMLPLRDGAGDTGHADDLSTSAPDPDRRPIPRPTGTPRPTVPRAAASQTGDGHGPRSTADVVSGAPELARLTLNVAATHHDSRVGGQRLVYGGRTIGLALAQATRRAAEPRHGARLGVLRPHRARARGGHALQRRRTSRTSAAAVLGLRSVVYAVGEPDRRSWTEIRARLSTSEAREWGVSGLAQADRPAATAPDFSRAAVLRLAGSTADVSPPGWASTWPPPRC